MRVFVTGGSGFLGKHLVKRLQARGDQVVALSSKECNWSVPQTLSEFPPGAFDRIYHLAAWTQAGDFCLRHPAEQWLINQKIHLHVLDWWAQSQPQAQMICIGTSCSYDPKLPLKEEYYLQGEPIESLFTYAMSKRMLLTGLIAFQKQWDLEYLYLIPSTLYGPSYHQDGRQMHFIFDLIRKILRAQQGEAPPSLWGDGQQKRELIHVEDFIDAMLFLEGRVKNTWVNIGGGKEQSIQEYAEWICHRVGYPSERILYDLSRYVGARSKVLDITKLRDLMPSFSPRSMQVGLHEVIEWFQKQPQLLQ